MESNKNNREFKKNENELEKKGKIYFGSTLVVQNILI